MNTKTLIINATAADSGGALAILKQVLRAIIEDDGWRYIVFIDENIRLECDKQNVTLEPISGVKSFIKRFMWDCFGVKKWLKQHSILPTATLSLQNTNFRTGYNIPNYIYLHQSIPFFNNKWSPLKKEERILWFYKNIYPIFIKLFLYKNTKLFVQLEYIKRESEKKFNVNRNNIYVVRPFFELPTDIKRRELELDSDRICLFYPAADLFYKNHSVLIEAMKGSNKKDQFVFYFTVQDGFMDRVDDLNFHVKTLGTVSFDTVMELYAKADALVFPSYIESYGLPLLEAASYGLPIIASNLPYAREVLEGYEGVIFVNHDDPVGWRNAIEKLKKAKRYNKIELSNDNSWNYMYQIIKNHTQNV